MTRLLTDGVVVLRFVQDPDDPDFWSITSGPVGGDTVTSWHYREAVETVIASRKRMGWLSVASEVEAAEICARGRAA